MTILVFSDLHKRIHLMRQALDRHPNVEYVFFLGDGLKEAEMIVQDYPSMVFVGVKGNCDPFFYDAPLDLTLELDGLRFYLHHGHTTNVKFTLEEVSSVTIKKRANICLFGHTHVPHYSYESDNEDHVFYLFNPGSIGASHNGTPSYGMIEIRKGQALFSHLTL